MTNGVLQVRTDEMMNWTNVSSPSALLTHKILQYTGRSLE